MAALWRKKKHEAALEETIANIRQLEEQIKSIDSGAASLPIEPAGSETPPACETRCTTERQAVLCTDTLVESICGAAPWLDEDMDEAMEQLKQEIERLKREEQVSILWSKGTPSSEY